MLSVYPTYLKRRFQRAIKRVRFIALQVMASLGLSTACEARPISLPALIERTGILGFVDARTIRVLAVRTTTRLPGGRCVDAEREGRRDGERQSSADQGKFFLHYVVLQKVLLPSEDSGRTTGYIQREADDRA